jgi:hypothetical protein
VLTHDRTPPSRCVPRELKSHIAESTGRRMMGEGGGSLSGGRGTGGSGGGGSWGSEGAGARGKATGDGTDGAVDLELCREVATYAAASPSSPIRTSLGNGTPARLALARGGGPDTTPSSATAHPPLGAEGLECSR